MRFVSCLLMLLPLASAELPFERTETTSPLKIGSRRRRLDHTRIYARIQPYDLYGNYLEWIDRPLYHDTRWRNGGAAAALRGDRRARQRARARSRRRHGVPQTHRRSTFCF